MQNAAGSDIFRLLKRLLFGAVGATIVLAAVVWGAANWRFINRAETVEGTVVNLDYGGSHPQIKFTAKDGTEIEYPQNGLIGGYQVGDRVTVYYDSQDARNCIVKSSGALWGFPTLAFVTGIFFVCVGLFSKFTPVKSL